MNLLKATYSIREEIWSVDLTNLHGGEFGDIHICFDSNLAPLPKNLKFGFSLYREDTVLLTKEYLNKGVEYLFVDNASLAVERSWFTSEYKHTINLWKSSGEDVSELKFDFVVPRPPQPYPSWSWSDGFWNPPIKKPINGPYNWDEEKQSWIPMFSPDSDYALMPRYGNKQYDPDLGKMVESLNDENHKPCIFGPTNQTEICKRC